ncbi:MAG: diguanylate cyclase [Cyanobacteria bacterium P01_F01_bin.150]
MQRFTQFLYRHSVICLASFISLCVSVAIAGSLVFGHHLLEVQSLQSAKAYSQIVKTAWTVYHDDVAQRLRSIDGITITSQYKNIVGGIPTPLAYINQLSQRLQSSPDSPQIVVRANVSSLTNQDAVADPFQKKAQDYLLRHNDAFYQVGTTEEYQAFSYAEPVLMIDKCKDCNLLPLETSSAVSTKDVEESMGFVTVHQPLTTMIESVERDTRIIGAASALLGCIGLMGGILINQQHKASQRILRDELEQKTIALERLDLTDSLTQVANKRQFLKALNQEWRRVWRQNGHLSLMICDIDYFKLYNESYGTQAGDQSLKQIAQAIQTQLKRAGDLVARFQDDEFYVLLPETNAAEAEEVAAMLLDAIHRLKIIHEQSDVSPYVSISIGIASTIPARDHHPDELIEQAEQALYNEAKQSGRNDFAVQAF